MRVSVYENIANFIGSLIDCILEYQGLYGKFVRPPRKIPNFPPHSGGRNGGPCFGDTSILLMFAGVHFVASYFCFH